MKLTRIAPLVVAASLCLGLAACGGGGGSSSAGSTTESTSTASAQESTTVTTAGEESRSQSASSGGGLTSPGTTLEAGQKAKVAWVPPGSFEPSQAQSGLELEVTVAAIETGSLEDFKNIELEPSQRHSTPYYVKVEIEALGSTAPPAGEEPALSFTAIDDRGQEQGSVTFLGNFPTCEEKTAPKPFTSGKSYESCLTYLMPGGGSIEKVEWNSGPSKANQVTPYFEHPIVWE